MKKLLFLSSILFVTLAFLGFASPAMASLLVPDYVTGNPKCDDLDVECTNEFEIDPPTAGLHTDPIGGITVNITLQPDNIFDWSSDIAVCAVIVKGGNNSNVYAYYEYASPVYADTGLHAPLNTSTPAIGDFYGLSHATFCYNRQVPEPSTMLLLGCGLFGLCLVGKRKLRSVK